MEVLGGGMHYGFCVTEFFVCISGTFLVLSATLGRFKSR